MSVTALRFRNVTEEVSGQEQWHQISAMSQNNPTLLFPLEIPLMYMRDCGLLSVTVLDLSTSVPVNWSFICSQSCDISTAKKFGIPESVPHTKLFNIKVWRSVSWWINTYSADRNMKTILCVSLYGPYFDNGTFFFFLCVPWHPAFPSLQACLSRVLNQKSLSFFLFCWPIDSSWWPDELFYLLVTFFECSNNMAHAIIRTDKTTQYAAGRALRRCHFL